ncbi:hypothetical protein ABZ214_12800 [Streptomyces iakyrus]|uniref:hypothetical protein n=1 Tax=Streptomyces iakyrus TaxID=68219 RepID=UPI0033B08427
MRSSEPAQPWLLDTPDQALPPVVYTPSAEEDAAVSGGGGGPGRSGPAAGAL